MSTRLFVLAALLVFATTAGAQPSAKPRVPLAGLKYIRIAPQTTGDSRAKSHDLAGYLEELLAQQGWVILRSVDGLLSAEAREKASQTALCVLDIDYSGFGTKALLICQDMLGNDLFTVLEKGVALSDGYELKVAVRNVAKAMAQERKQFDPRQTVDIVSRMPPAQTSPLTAASLDAMIDNGKLTDQIEGLWATPSGAAYRVGIVPDPDARDFLVVVLESPATYLWQPGMVMGRLTPGADGQTFIARWKDLDRQDMSGLGTVRSGVLTLTLNDNGKERTLSFLKLRPSATRASAAPTPGPPTGRGSGTGFFCAPGIIATNHHVIEGAKQIEFRLPGQNRSVALELIVSDPANDIALLRVLGSDTPLPPALRLTESANVRLASQAFVVGFPLGDALGSGHKVTAGVISGLDGLKGDPRKLQLTAQIQPGSSGSPVFDSAGRVVGIITSSLDSLQSLKATGDVPQNVNFALKTDYLTLLLKRLPPSGATAAPLDALEVHVPDMIEKVRGSVGQVRVVR